MNVLTSLSDFVQPLNYINLNVAAFQKSPTTNTYRSVIVNVSIEVCSAMGDEASPLMKHCMPMILRFAPNFVHPCPYEGQNIGVENFPIDVSFLPLIQFSTLPKGDYRVVALKLRQFNSFSLNFFLRT